MVSTGEILISAVKSALTDSTFAYSEIDAKALFELSKLHDLTHLVAYGLTKQKKINLLAEYTDNFIASQTRAVFRHVKIVKELSDMANSFERGGVDFIFLKGSKLRFYYPEAWMRTSSDIDVLVRPDCIEKAHEILTKLNYKYLDEWSYERRYDTPSGVHVEMHTDLTDDSAKVDEYLKSVWDRVVLEEGYTHKYKMTDSMFLYYHVVHMAKHFLDGGCGVRPFIDLYVLDGTGECDEFFSMLKDSDLEAFYVKSKALINKWFGSGAIVPSSMDEYVLNGGLFGTYDNVVLSRGDKGKFKYVWGRIFPPYKDMKEHHKVLKRHKWLLPFFYVARWFRLFWKLITGKGKDEIKAVSGMDAKRVEDAQKLFKDLGLKS